MLRQELRATLERLRSCSGNPHLSAALQPPAAGASAEPLRVAQGASPVGGPVTSPGWTAPRLRACSASATRF